jgi:hypothetical protein
METQDGVLKRFMEEFFDFKELVKVGLFTKEMKGDYKAQAEKICHYFGYESVYEYGAKEIRCHLTFVGKRPDNEPFITVIPSIYE